MALGAALGRGRQNSTQSLGEGSMAGDGTTQDGRGAGEAVGMKLVGELVAFLF